MGSTYYLGWPGLESAPVHVINIKAHQIFNKTKPLPNALALVLNKVENRYVELSWIVNRFSVSQQQAALNVLMKLVGDLSMPKFYVGPDNVAYVPLNTLFTFVVCYPQNASFRICRSSLLNHLATFFEMACSICGFVRRDCICESRFYDMEKENFIGFVKEIRSTGIQCQESELPKPAVYTSSDKIQEIVDEVARGGVEDSAPQMPPFVASSTPSPNFPPRGAHPFPWATPQMKTFLPSMLPPPPLPPPKPKTREIGIQTRAVYDFSNRKKRLSKKEREDEAIIEAQIAASEKTKVIQEETAEDVEKEKENGGEDEKEKAEESKDPTTPQISQTSPEKTTTPLSVLNAMQAVTPEPTMRSYWRLLSDDDSSDEEEEKETEQVESDQTKYDNKQTDNTEKKTEDSETKDQEKDEEKISAEDNVEKDTEKEENISSTMIKVHGNEESDHMDTAENKEDTVQKTAKPMDTSETNTIGERSVACETTEKEENSETSPNISQETPPHEAKKSFQEEFLKSIQKSAPEKEGKSLDDSLTEYQNKLEQVIEDVKSNSGRSTPSAEIPDTNLGDNDTTENKTPNVSESEIKASDNVPSENKETTSKPDTSTNTEDSGEMLPVDREKQVGVLCEITGRVVAEGTKPAEEVVVIPPSPPPTDPLPYVLPPDPKPKAKLLAKRWVQKFEYSLTGEKIYRCTFSRCGQCFDTRQAAKLHDKSHGAFGQEFPTSLVCWECDKYTTTFSKWYDLLRHLRVKHDITIGSSVPNSFPCTFCGVALHSEDRLNYHINFHYLGKYKCVHCGVLLLTWKQVQVHLEKDCPEAASKKEKKLGCPYCSFVFHIRNMRNIHMLSHIDEGLVCIFCENNELWENWKQLRKHYQQKHGRKVTSAMNPLKPTKMEIKQNPRCHVCDAEFKVFEDFVYHMRKIHDFVAYVATDCQYCEKTFRTQKAYDWHAKNTHGICADGTLTALRCKQCEYVATSKQMLRAHVAKKHDEKQHECNECGKTFTYYNQLRVHMVQHARKAMYPCKHCEVEFSRHADLRAHVREQHSKRAPGGEDSRQCPECSFSCSSDANLQGHIDRHHPEYEEDTISKNDPDHEEPDLSDPDFQPALKMAPPKPPPPDPASLPPKPLKPKGRRTYYKGGRRGRGRGKRGGGSGRGTGGTGVKSLPYLKERRPGRKSTDMPEIGMNLDEIPDLLAGGPMDRDDKKKIKRLMKIKEARIKFHQKACCARSVSYQDHMAMKALDSSTAFSPIANFELNGEPLHKRRRLSSSTSSNVPAYAQQSTYETTYSPYEPSVKLPTQIPESYDMLVYPFIDHCYFKMEGMVLPEDKGGMGPVRYTDTLQGDDLRGMHDGSQSTRMMRGVYKPTPWGSLGGGTGGSSYGDDVDVDGGGFEPVMPQSSTSSEYQAFPSTSFAPPPPMPSRRSSTETSRRKRGGRRGASSGRRPYSTGKFVPLAPTHEYAAGIQDNSAANVTIMPNSDTVPLDQFGVDGDVAVQHEVGEAEGDDSFSGVDLLGPSGDDLIQAPAAEDLMENIPQDHLLKDLISQLEHRVQTSTSTSSVPQSPTVSAIMRTLMQSPPGSKISGRRLSLGSSTPQHQSLFDADVQSNQIEGIQPIISMPQPASTSTQNEDCMVTVVSNQPTLATDSIASILPSSIATTPTSSGTSDIDESTLNEVYQLLGSKFDNLEDLQKQVGFTATSPSPKSNQVTTIPAVTSPEVIFTAKTTPATSMSFTPGPGSTARYRTMMRNVTTAQSSTATQSSQVIYQSGGSKRIQRVVRMPPSKKPRVITLPTDSEMTAQALMSQNVESTSVTSSIISDSPSSITSLSPLTSNSTIPGNSSNTITIPSNSDASCNSLLAPAVTQMNTTTTVTQGFQMPAESTSSPVTSSAAATTSGSGRIPVRIQLAGNMQGTSSGPMRICLPSGASLGQNVTKISLQQLLKSGASIQSVPPGQVGKPGTRIIRVPAGSLTKGSLTSASVSPSTSSPMSSRILTLPSPGVQNVKIAGNNVFTVPPNQKGMRVVQVARGGMYPTAESIVKPQDETQSAVESIMSADAMDNSVSETALDSNQVRTVQDELMDALPTDEEIAQNIQAEHMEDTGAMGTDMSM